MATVIKPPTPVAPGVGPLVFLSGSIDMGRAAPWQDEVVASLGDRDVVFLNPRRDDWDASWAQTITEPRFREQVEWELGGLERADVVLVYFAADSQAPITLLELGLVAARSAVAVYCDPGFWRRGNVEVVCDRYDLALFDDQAPFLAAADALIAAALDARG